MGDYLGMNTTEVIICFQAFSYGQSMSGSDNARMYGVGLNSLDMRVTYGIIIVSALLT